MGTVATWAPGQVSWVDLGTTDPEAAAEFYGHLLGWDVAQLPSGYTMARLGRAAVAGIYRLPDELVGYGVPPNWLPYVLVADVDATAASVVARGGAVRRAVADIGDEGRFAVVADPEGAVLGLWQPGTFEGAGAVGEPGALAWAEVDARSFEPDLEFYADVFGWQAETVPSSGPPYRMFKRDHRFVAGIMDVHAVSTPRLPPAWLVYFAVGDADEAARRVAELGGTVLAAPAASPYGRFLIARDPQGAVFGLIALRTPY